MVFIIGLGNPEEKYKKTRHNIGNEFYKYIKLEDFSYKNLLNFINIKEEVYMNESIKNFDKKTILTLKNHLSNIPLIVLHDDIDIKIGDIKISKNKNHGGHNGLKSIINTLNNKDFYRIRIGILPNTKPSKDEIPNFVLSKFTNEENIILKNIKEKTLINKLESILKNFV